MWCIRTMRLFFFRNGRLEHYDLPSRSKCSASDVEKAIREMANRRGDISTVSIQVGNAYIPIAHVDEARVVSQMIAADHDCFSSHFYEKGFAEPEPTTKPSRGKGGGHNRTCTRPARCTSSNLTMSNTKTLAPPVLGVPTIILMYTEVALFIFLCFRRVYVRTCRGKCRDPST